MIDKETSLGLEIRQNLNIAKKKEMHKERKEQRHTEEQGPEKTEGLERPQKAKMCRHRKRTCFHRSREVSQLGLGVGPKKEMLFAAHRGVKAGTAQLL